MDTATCVEELWAAAGVPEARVGERVVCMTPDPVDHSGQGASAQGGPRVVFVADFVHLEVPFEELSPVLLATDAWVRRLEERSSQDGGEPGGRRDPPGVTTAMVQVGPEGKYAQQTVSVTAGPARAHDRLVIVPITWEPVKFESLLPSLEADLELSALDESATRLAINARYRVPLGELGLRLDRVAMHRVAESSLRRFLHDVQTSLLAEL
jgi:hypothetical protein